MALADVLSAIREIVLDAPHLPEELSERAVLFREKFPGLSESEQEDLAKIDPKKFSIYTVSIFQGEKGILENHFPITFELVKLHWAEAYNERFLARLIPQRMHRVRPWRSQSPLNFARNFCEYLNYDCAPLLALRPDLGAIAQLETATYRLRRAADSVVPLRKSDVIPLERLASTVIDELLNARITVTAHLECLELPFDVLPARELFYANNRSAPQDISRAEQSFIVGTRNKKNTNFWLRVREVIFEILKRSHQNDTPLSVEEFAAELADHLPEGLSEQGIFEELMKELALLMAHEYITLERQS